MRKFKDGYIIIQTLVFGTVAALLLGALMGWAVINLKLGDRVILSEKAFHVAEAGIEYYRWHLAHNPLDFTDGTGESGPYVHQYKNKDGESIGNFTLDIEPPPIGSTIVTVVSTGQPIENENIKRSIEVKMAIPSIAKYAFVANSKMRFGEGTEVVGPIHSNDGIRFDGFAHNLVTSAKPQYDDPDHSGFEEFGVHTHLSPIDPLPPTEVPNRLDVFAAGRLFPVPAVDFNGFTASVADIKSKAQAEGLYFSASGAFGYNLVLKTDNTFDLYRVDNLVSPPSGCINIYDQPNWGTWSIASQTFLANYPFPDNGLIFAEDDIWVEGQIDGSRLTIASARFPEGSSPDSHITVNNNLTYTYYDGRDVIALIAQGNINVGMVSQNNLQIDAALVAKNGRVGRFYYRPPYWIYSRCSPYHTRSTIDLFGMIGTNERYGFAYTDGNGYDIRNIAYDGNFLYGPPPSFPLASDFYETISWREVNN